MADETTTGAEGSNHSQNGGDLPAEALAKAGASKKELPPPTQEPLLETHSATSGIPQSEPLLPPHMETAVSATPPTPKTTPAIHPPLETHPPEQVKDKIPVVAPPHVAPAPVAPPQTPSAAHEEIKMEHDHPVPPVPPTQHKEGDAGSAHAVPSLIKMPSKEPVGEMPHIDMPPLRMPHAPITKLELDIPSITVMEGDTQKAPQKEIPPVKKGETPVPAMVKPPKEMPLPSAPATPRVIEMPPIVVEETDLSEVLKKPVTPPPAGLHAASTPAAVAAAAHVKEKADSQAQSGPFKGEINKILKDIKLPERRDFKGAADKKPSVAPAPGAVPEATIVSETVIPQSPQAAAARSAEPKGTISEISTIQPTAAPGESLATMITKEAEAKKSGIKSIGDGLVIPLRTLKEDLQHVITSRGMSLVRAVALEQDKKRDGPHLTAAEMAAHRQRSRRVFAVIFASAILFFLGVAALVGVYTIQNTRTSAVDIGPDNSILFAEQTVAFPIDEQSSSDIKRTLAQARGGSNATLGSITRIVPTINNGGIGPRPVTTREFFQALDVHAPDELIRALSDSFFMGIHTVDKNAPVLVFGVQSYDHAFAGMLAWEGTINADLGPFFTPVPPLAPDADGLPTTRPFRDIVMRNYDVRALRDDGNVIQLYYSFPTPNLLIIAESPYSFTEVLSRLQAERRL